MESISNTSPSATLISSGTASASKDSPAKLDTPGIPLNMTTEQLQAYEFFWQLTQQ